MDNKQLMTDLVQALVVAGHERRQAETFVRSFFSELEKALFRGEAVKVNGLGTFRLQSVDARESVNIRTGEKFEIEGHYKLSFAADESLKAAVNVPFAHLETVEVPAEAADQSGETPTQSEEAAAQAGKPALPSEEAALEENEPNTDTAMKTKKEPIFKVEESSAAQPASPKAIKKQAATVSPETKKSEAPEVPQNTISEAKETAKPGRSSVWGWVVFAVLLLALIVYALVSMLGGKNVASKKAVVPAREVVAETVVAPAETVAAPTQTAPAAPEEVIDPATWPVYKEVRMEKGQRLTLLSLKYYGDKVYWVYIYEANRDHIQNPNHIKAGTKVRIPLAPGSVVNLKSEASYNRAKALEDKYRAQFGK